MSSRAKSMKTGFVGSRREIEAFLALFTDIERALKRRLGRNDKVSDLIKAYRQQNPYWAGRAEELDLMREIRNLLTHARSAADGYPVLVRSRMVDRLRTIVDELTQPVTVGERFRREVARVGPSDTLQSVLHLAYENSFSQFPVIQDDRFLGLVTENAVVRWLGDHARTAAGPIDLDAVRVKQVMGRGEPGRKASILRWAADADPVEEVMGHFLLTPELEVVLVTRDGKAGPELTGIVTQWDAARFSPEPKRERSS